MGCSGRGCKPIPPFCWSHSAKATTSTTPHSGRLEPRNMPRRRDPPDRAHHRSNPPRSASELNSAYMSGACFRPPDPRRHPRLTHVEPPPLSFTSGQPEHAPRSRGSAGDALSTGRNEAIDGQASRMCAPRSTLEDHRPNRARLPWAVECRGAVPSSQERWRRALGSLAPMDRRPTVMLAPELTSQQRRAEKVFELDRWFPALVSCRHLQPASA